MADYIPKTDDGLTPWLANLKTKIPDFALPLGITPERVIQVTDWCDGLAESIQIAGQKKTDWLSVVAEKQEVAITNIAGLRGEIAQWKAAPGMNEAIAAALQITGGSTPFNPETYKTTLTAEVFSGYVRIKFKKQGVEGVNLYSRKRGEPGWKFVARDTNSPYDDHTPLGTAGVPETREYQAFGVLGDEQIGQGSDIVSVTFAG